MKREAQYQVANQLTPVRLEQSGDLYRVVVGGNAYQVRAKQTGDGRLLLEVDGQRLQAYVASNGDKHYVWLDGNCWILQRADPETKPSAARTLAVSKDGTNVLTATMPGLVRDVLAKEGDVVTRGAALVVLEAMKMELRITAPYAGHIGKVHCVPGQVVERGQVLVEISESVKQ
jgi:3-methylcrotonyl-CoA carboxylase alpha subunit